MHWVLLLLQAPQVSSPVNIDWLPIFLGAEPWHAPRQSMHDKEPQGNSGRHTGLARTKLEACSPCGGGGCVAVALKGHQHGQALFRAQLQLLADLLNHSLAARMDAEMLKRRCEVRHIWLQAHPKHLQSETPHPKHDEHCLCMHGRYMWSHKGLPLQHLNVPALAAEAARHLTASQCSHQAA